MDRTTITLDVETRTQLRRIAADRGISMAALIREAIDATIEEHAPRRRSLGIGASGTAGNRAGSRRAAPRATRVALILDTGPLYASLDRSRPGSRRMPRP